MCVVSSDKLNCVCVFVRVLVCALCALCLLTSLTACACVGVRLLTPVWASRPRTRSQSLQLTFSCRSTSSWFSPQTGPTLRTPVTCMPTKTSNWRRSRSSWTSRHAPRNASIPTHKEEDAHAHTHTCTQPHPHTHTHSQTILYTIHQTSWRPMLAALFWAEKALGSHE